jgi:hypothetical protein
MATPMLETVVEPCMEVIMLLQTATAAQTHRSLDDSGARPGPGAV